jgi:hypothetical protein
VKVDSGEIGLAFHTYMTRLNRFNNQSQYDQKDPPRLNRKKSLTGQADYRGIVIFVRLAMGALARYPI